MKIAILLAAVSMHVAGATSVGPPKAKKPDRRGVVLAGGHRVPPHDRRTTAKTHSKGRNHLAPHSRRTAARTRTKVTLDDPLRASTRGAGGRIGVKQAPDATDAPTPAPTPAPFGGTQTWPTVDSEWFNAFSPSSGGDWGECPPPLDVLEMFGMTADDFDCEGGGDLFVDDECAEMYNSTSPCPPAEVIALLNLTLAELACDSDVLPPCPYPELATQLGLDVGSLKCDKEYWCFSHNHINLNSTKACSSNPAIQELEYLYGVWCEYGDTDWFAGLGDDFNYTEFNYTTLECPAPVPCSLPWGGEGATGIVACAGAFGDFSGWTMCVDPTETLEGDTCGCCGGTCPEPCTGTSCKVPDWFSEETGGNTTAKAETGVWLVDTEGGYAQCVSSAQSALMQMDGYFTCMNACSTP